MKKICHIRGRKNYFIDNVSFSVDIDDEARSFLGHYSTCGHMIEFWSNNLKIPYYNFREKIRNIILNDIKSSNFFDFVCENDNDFHELLKGIPPDEKILVYQQDDDDIFLPNLLVDEKFNYGVTKFKLICLDFINFYRKGFKNKIPGINNEHEMRYIYPQAFDINNYLNIPEIHEQYHLTKAAKQSKKYKEYKRKLQHILFDRGFIDKTDYLGTNNYIINVESRFFDIKTHEWRGKWWSENIHRWYSNHHAVWPAVYYKKLPITSSFHTSAGIYINHLSSLCILKGSENNSELLDRLKKMKTGMHNIINNNMNISNEDQTILSKARPTLDKIITVYNTL